MPPPVCRVQHALLAQAVAASFRKARSSGAGSNSMAAAAAVAASEVSAFISEHTSDTTTRGQAAWHGCSARAVSCLEAPGVLV